MFFNVVLLGLWALALSLWLQRHFPVIDHWLLLVALPLSSALFTGIMDWFTSQQQRQQMKDNVRDFVLARLDKRLLALLYSLLAIFMLTNTSISLAPTGDNNTRKVSVYSLHDNKAKISSTLEANTTLQIPMLLVNPLENQYLLRLDGYLDKIITLSPLTGAVVVPQRDLQPLPSVLFRPMFTQATTLNQGGSMHWWVKQDDNNYKEVVQKQGKHAWLSGAQRSLPAELQYQWTLQTTALSYTESMQASMLLLWQQPLRLQSGTPAVPVQFKPGQRVCVLVSDPDGEKFTAGSLTRLSNAPYQDIQVGEYKAGGLPDAEGNISTDGSAVCRQLEQRDSR